MALGLPPSQGRFFCAVMINVTDNPFSSIIAPGLRAGANYQMTGAGRQRVSFLPLSDGLAFLMEALAARSKRGHASFS
jgi:hypothetical protein